MHPRTRARIATAILAAGAIASYALGNVPGSVALLVAAAAVFILVPDRSVPERTAQALADQDLSDVTDALRLGGQGIFVPYKDRAKLFVPAQTIEASEAPTFDGRTLLAQRPPVGLWMDSPGQALYALWVAQGRPVQAGLEGATATLKQALPALGLARGIRVEKGRTIRITAKQLLTGTGDATRAWHLQGGDATTSFIGLVLATAMGPVRLQDRHDADDGHVWEWQP